jgi:hypothetical protein
MTATIVVQLSAVAAAAGYTQPLKARNSFEHVYIGGHTSPLESFVIVHTVQSIHIQYATSSPSAHCELLAVQQLYSLLIALLCALH